VVAISAKGLSVLGVCVLFLAKLQRLFEVVRGVVVLVSYRHLL
jgi:hypothetical protein